MWLAFPNPDGICVRAKCREPMVTRATEETTPDCSWKTGSKRKKRFGIGIWKGKDCFPGRTCHLSWGFNQPYPKMTPSIIRAEGLNQTTTHNHYASIIGRVTDLGAGWIPMKIWRKWKTLFQTKLVCLLVELTSYKSVSHHIYGMTIPFTTITIINITGISAFNWKGKYQQRQFSSPWHPDDSSGVH